MNCALQITNDIESISVSQSYRCSPERCSEFIPSVNDSVTVIHLNIRSIGCNFDEFQVLLKRINLIFDVIILSECWLSKCRYFPLLPGYISFKSNFSNQNDGVVVFVRAGLSCTVTKLTLHNANCLLLKFSNELAIVAVYRSPSVRDMSNFLTALDSTLLSLRHFKTISLIGDININILPDSCDTNADAYLTLLAAHAMLPAHTFQTRSNSCLDHVILKTNAPAVTLVLDTFITDHAPVVFSCSKKVKLSRSERTKLITDETACVRDIELTNFTFIMSMSDAEVAADAFVNALINIINMNTRSINISSKNRLIKPWMTPGLLRCIRNRDRLHKSHKRDPDNITTRLTYTRYRNYCKNLLKKIKLAYERGEFMKAKNNPKTTWKLIKNIANFNNKSDSPSDLLQISTTPERSINAVNEYFSNIGQNLSSKCINLSTSGISSPLVSSPRLNSMALIKTDCQEIESILIGLKKSAVGWDNISVSLLKAARHFLIPVLTHVFNLCFMSGTFPTVFKEAIVLPIYKSGHRGIVNNYRPISILSTLSKVIEKILNNRLINYLNKYHILSDRQFGFRKGRCTEDAVLELSNTIVRNFNTKLKTIGIFLDLSKAFDTVSIPILLSKLEKIGVRGQVQEIFKSYLSNRKQRVKIDGYLSQCQTLTCGVPQGSVLGPTLFLVYINDLCNLAIINTKIFAYADDTALLIQAASWAEARANAESAMRVVMIWLNNNLLTLNPDKTIFTTFSLSASTLPQQPLSIFAHCCNPDVITCSCSTLQHSNSVRYLGVHLDSLLTWKDHLDTIVRKLRKLIYIFKTLRSIVDTQTLKSVYLSLVQSILTYCITVWGGSAKTRFLRVERAQRAILKVMFHKPVLFPTSEVFKIAKVLTVRQLFIRNVILRKHVTLPFLHKNNTFRRRPERACELKRCRTALGKQNYEYLASLIYNKVNNILNIYPLTYWECEKKLNYYLQNLLYDESEALLKL